MLEFTVVVLLFLILIVMGYAVSAINSSIKEIKEDLEVLLGMSAIDLLIIENNKILNVLIEEVQRAKELIGRR